MYECVGVCVSECECTIVFRETTVEKGNLCKVCDIYINGFGFSALVLSSRSCENFKIAKPEIVR